MTPIQSSTPSCQTCCFRLSSVIPIALIVIGSVGLAQASLGIPFAGSVSLTGVGCVSLLAWVAMIPRNRQANNETDPEDYNNEIDPEDYNNEIDPEDYNNEIDPEDYIHEIDPEDYNHEIDPKDYNPEQFKELLTHNSESKSLKIPPTYTDDYLAHVDNLKHLTILDLSDCTMITDEGLKLLASCSGIQILHLSGCTKITDNGLAHLKNFPQLKRVSFDDCPNITTKAKNQLVTERKLVVLNRTRA